MPMVLAALLLVWQVTHQMSDIQSAFGDTLHRMKKWEAPLQSHEKDTPTVLAGVIKTNIFQELISKRFVVRID